MSAFEWSISGPIDTSWTPAELAQIARAAQAFIAALPNPKGRTVHLVRLDGLDVLGPESARCPKTLALSEQLLHCTFAENHPDDCAFA